MAAPTVVSAYYPIKSKFGSEKYVEWMHFWPKTQCPLVFFTDPCISGQIEQMFKDRRAPTKVIGLPFDRLGAVRKLSPSVWHDAHKIDPERERHSPELYAIWYEKKEFVLRAIELNPFGSEHFVWCDAGICRYPEWTPQLQSFPRRENVPAGKMLVLRINPFDSEPPPPDKHGIRGDFTNASSVGGGILASDINGWRAWNKHYDAMLMRYLLAGRFIGKDQNIMASMILERPDSVVLVDPAPAMNSVQLWFYLLFYLAGVRVE